MATSSGDRFAAGIDGGIAAGGYGSGCSTPFVSAPSSPARDASVSAAAGCFYSAPASPARCGGPGAGDEYGCEQGLDFDFAFDFSSRCPSPAATGMSSADELFHNGQIRPMRLASFLLRPQALPPLDGDAPAALPPPPSEAPAPADDGRGRFRSRSAHRRSRSVSPFRTRWLLAPSSPAPATKPVEPATGGAAPSASRSSSSSSTASSASSSSSRSYRSWGFLKDLHLLLHRSKSDGGKKPHCPSNSPSPPTPAPKRSGSPSPAVSQGWGSARRSAHARLYEARRAEAEEMRRRTFLPYRQGVLVGCLGLGSRGYGGAMHGLAAAAAAAGKSRP